MPAIDDLTNDPAWNASCATTALRVQNRDLCNQIWAKHRCERGHEYACAQLESETGASKGASSAGRLKTARPADSTPAAAPVEPAKAGAPQTAEAAAGRASAANVASPRELGPGEYVATISPWYDFTGGGKGVIERVTFSGRVYALVDEDTRELKSLHFCRGDQPETPAPNYQVFGWTDALGPGEQPILHDPGSTRGVKVTGGPRGWAAMRDGFIRLDEFGAEELAGTLGGPLHTRSNAPRGMPKQLEYQSWFRATRLPTTHQVSPADCRPLP